MDLNANILLLYAGAVAFPQPVNVEMIKRQKGRPGNSGQPFAFVNVCVILCSRRDLIHKPSR